MWEVSEDAAVRSEPESTDITLLPAPTADRSIRSLLEFLRERVWVWCEWEPASGLWIFGGSGFSLPSGGSRFSIVARPDKSENMEVVWALVESSHQNMFPHKFHCCLLQIIILNLVSEILPSFKYFLVCYCLIEKVKEAHDVWWSFGKWFKVN